jgi:3-oxoadipate enol-lactonase
VTDLAGDVVAVLEKMGLPRAHVLGASPGGMVAQEVAIEHPDRVDRLVLACTTPGWPYAYPMPAPSTRLMTATRTLPPAVALRRHVENSLAADTVAARPELVERLIRHQKARPSRPDSFSALATAGGRYSGGLRQQRIRARTLVLHGAADRVVDPRNSALLARRIPGARQVTLPGLGHLFFWEDPAAVVATVTDFLTGG